MAFEEQGGGAISNINVTPLVDVMLVLLVIFMVTAPILQQGVNINLPKVRAAALTGEEQQLVVAVTRNGQVYLNDTPTQIAELGPKLQAILKLRPDRQVYLRADQNVRYGEVMQVIATVKGAGVERLGMVTEPPSSRPPLSLQMILLAAAIRDRAGESTHDARAESHPARRTRMGSQPVAHGRRVRGAACDCDHAADRHPVHVSAPAAGVEVVYRRSHRPRSRRRNQHDRRRQRSRRGPADGRRPQGGGTQAATAAEGGAAETAGTEARAAEGGTTEAGAAEGSRQA